MKPRALRTSSCPQRQAVARSTLSTAPGTRARRYTETLRSACQVLGTGDCRERWLGTQRSCLRGARVLATPRAGQPGPHRAPHLLAAGPSARHPQPPRACDRDQSGQRLNVTLYRHFAGDRAAPTCPPRLASCSRSPGESCGQPRVVRRGGNSGRVASSPAGLQMSSSPSPPFGFWLKQQRGVGWGERGNRCLGRMEAILEEEPRPCPPPRAGDTRGRPSRQALPRTARPLLLLRPAGWPPRAVSREQVPQSPPWREAEHSPGPRLRPCLPLSDRSQRHFCQSYTRNGCFGSGCHKERRAAFPTVNLPSSARTEMDKPW